MRNYLGNKVNPWEGMIIFHIPCDGYGNLFGQGNRCVCFDNQDLVGEFRTRTQAETAFLKGVRIEGGVKLIDYVGIDEDLRAHAQRQVYETANKTV